MMHNGTKMIDPGLLDALDLAKDTPTFCIEQLIQVALMQVLREYSDEQLYVLMRYAEEVEIMFQGKEGAPRFLPTFKRALDLTLAIRDELDADQRGVRVEPHSTRVIQDSAELFLFKNQ